MEPYHIFLFEQTWTIDCVCSLGFHSCLNFLQSQFSLTRSSPVQLRFHCYNTPCGFKRWACLPTAVVFSLLQHCVKRTRSIKPQHHNISLHPTTTSPPSQFSSQPHNSTLHNTTPHRIFFTRTIYSHHLCLKVIILFEYISIKFRFICCFPRFRT